MNNFVLNEGSHLTTIAFIGNESNTLNAGKAKRCDKFNICELKVLRNKKSKKRFSLEVGVRFYFVSHVFANGKYKLVPSITHCTKMPFVHSFISFSANILPQDNLKVNKRGYNGFVSSLWTDS